MIMAKGPEADPIILEALFYNDQGLTTTELARILYPEDGAVPDLRRNASFIQYRLKRLVDMKLVNVEAGDGGRKYTLASGAVLGQSLLLVSRGDEEDDIVQLPLGRALAIVPGEGQEPKVMFLDDT